MGSGDMGSTVRAAERKNARCLEIQVEVAEGDTTSWGDWNGMGRLRGIWRLLEVDLVCQLS